MVTFALGTGYRVGRWQGASSMVHMDGGGGGAGQARCGKEDKVGGKFEVARGWLWCPGMCVGATRGAPGAGGVMESGGSAARRGEAGRCREGQPWPDAATPPSSSALHINANALA